ncbi:MAG: hypothetical protein IM613_20245 [Cytophagales bacterium]|nr:hypothetical protein [Cytophagales bacterium]
MKKLLVVNLIFAFSQCFAQSVNFLLSYELAVQKSKENKLPCLVIIAPEVNCKDCPKINFKRKFESKGLREIFSGYNIYISRDMETEGSKLLVKFGRPPRLPLFVFLSEAEEVLHYASGWSDDDSFFARMDQEVKDRNKKGSYYFYLKNYSSKKTDRLFLREMIELQSSRNMLFADSVLSDYSKTFSDEELQLLENRTYIISKGLVFESELYKKIVPNSDFRQIFASMPIGERANTNSKIIQKTIFAAIKKRDTALAYMGSRFAERTWSANPKRGYLAYVSNMRSFYGLRFKSLAQQITKSNLLQNERIQKTYL